LPRRRLKFLTLSIVEGKLKACPTRGTLPPPL
jgi:hypothetical protein